MTASTVTAQKRVLVVEDDEPSALVARETLTLMGCDVTLANAGDEVVALVLRSRFSLVFMDYHLPKMNGLEATTRIRQHEAMHSTPRTSIVGLTASAMPEERAACLSAGMDDVLLKPFMLVEMQSMVARWASL